MYECGDNKDSFCYFHPKEMGVGVCCLCLNQRLLLLASNQPKTSKIRNKNNFKSFSRIFSFTNSLVHRFEFRCREPLSKINYENSQDNDDDDTSTSSQEDAFISIKFENNGDASWEKRNLPLENVDSKDVKCSTSVIKHAKSRSPSLRWRKRIGYFFQVIRWKRSSQMNVCHVAPKLEGVKVRNRWIRSLAKRKRSK